MTNAMRTFFTTMWRTIMLRGLASVGFGVLAIAYPHPEITLAVVVTIFGIYALVDGLLGLWGIYRGKRKEGMSVPALLTALAGIAAGLVCLLFPGFALTYVLLLIGLWNVAAGLLQMIGSLVLRNEIEHGWLMALGGLLGAGLGLLIMLYPADAAVSIIWLIAGTAIALGLLLVLFAWRLRAAGKRIA
jgi:uncharacterized membrane protein HdeD (DUF308 family)